MKVMISYNRGEWSDVQSVLADLYKAGLPVWIDREQLRAGTEWRGELLFHARTADAFVPFLSPRYVGSAMCRMELLMARSFRRPIFPVMLEECWEELTTQEETQFISTLFTARISTCRIVGLKVEREEIIRRLRSAIEKTLNRQSRPEPNVYISYANMAAEYATLSVRDSLAQTPSIRPWIATRDCEVGEDWREAQTQALTRAKVHVVVIGGDILRDTQRDSQVLRTEVLISEALGIPTICLEDQEVNFDSMLKADVLARLERDPGFRRLTVKQWLTPLDVETVLRNEIVGLLDRSPEHVAASKCGPSV